jgi:hypothetical protein
MLDTVVTYLLAGLGGGGVESLANKEKGVGASETDDTDFSDGGGAARGGWRRDLKLPQLLQR